MQSSSGNPVPQDSMTAQVVQPAAPAKLDPDSPQGRVFLSTWAGVMLPFVLGSIATVVGFWVAFRFLRRRREITEGKSASGPRGGPVAQRVDPWEEAGRRMRVEDLPPGSESDSAEREEARQAGDGEEKSADQRPRSRSAVRPSIPGGGGRNQARPLALITGAAKRVGRAVAIDLARCGCDVIFTYHTSRGEAEALARELAGFGVEVTFYQLDLNDLEAVEAFASQLSQTLERLDVLVHNASVYGATPLETLEIEDAMRHWRVNALAPLLLTARLSVLLSRSQLKGGGSVVAMADIHAMGRPRKDFSAYAMSKAAVVELVQTLARDLAPAVRVNGVAPGVVAWPESGYESDKASQEKYIKRIPMERSGTPEEAAAVVRWLSLEATYLTGEVIRVDGGRWLT